MTITSLRRFVLAIAVALLALVGWPRAQSLQKVTINYPTRSGASWPLYIAKEGGYYQKYGLDVDLQFGVHPAGIAMLTSGQAVMVNHSLEQGMVASSKDGSMAMMGSSSNKGLFALMGQKEIKDRRRGAPVLFSLVAQKPCPKLSRLVGSLLGRVAATVLNCHGLEGAHDGPREPLDDLLACRGVFAGRATGVCGGVVEGFLCRARQRPMRQQ